MPSDTLLVRVGGAKVYLVGTITLLATTGTYPHQLTKEVSFLVVNCSFAYNAIIGQPTLNTWKVAMSTYHLLVKLPTVYGIGEACGDQFSTRECYIAMLEMDDHLQALFIEERRVVVEPTEDLEEISLDNNILSKITRVGPQADPSIRKELTLFLKKNQDIFALSHEDMPGINASVIVHKFNVCPSFPPIRQKKSLHSREGQSQSRTSPQATRSRLHQGGILS